MKPGLAVLPLEVWADVFLSQWFTRQELTEFYNNIKNRGFANKLEKLLHDCGKQTLHYIRITSMLKKNLSKYELRKRKIAQYRAYLRAAPGGYQSNGCVSRPEYKHYEFPETELPNNVNFLDDKVLNFLDKIKPLFTNVFLNIDSIQSATDMRILFGHFLPMLDGIRGINCVDHCLQLLDRHFPKALALAKELELFSAEPTSIPAYLNWLSAPQDFDLHGPKLLQISFTESETIFAIVNAVRKQFLAATSSATFVIFLKFKYAERHKRAEEFSIENAATNEQLTVQNFTMPQIYIGSAHCVQILRHPAGADAEMQEWVEERACFEKKHNYDEEEMRLYDEADQVIWINQPTIGCITKKKKKVKTKSADDSEEDEAGPSTSTKKIRK